MTTRLRVLAMALVLAAWTSAVLLADDKDDNAAQVIEKLGGRLTRNGKTIIAVYLGGTKVTDADLKALKELKDLQDLRLPGTQITDIGLKELKGLKNLKVLGLVGTQVTAAGVKEIQDALPQCRINSGGAVGGGMAGGPAGRNAAANPNEFDAQILKISKGKITFRKNPMGGGGFQILTMPTTKDVKVFTKQRFFARGQGTNEKGPELACGLLNEEFKLAIATTEMNPATIVTDEGGKAIKEIHVSIFAGRLRNQPPAPLQPVNGPQGEIDNDPLPEHAVARLGSLRFRHSAGASGRPRAGYGIPPVAVSPDGHLLASAESGLLQLWDAKTGLLLSSIESEDRTEQGGPFAPPRVALAFSPDSLQLAAYFVAGRISFFSVETEKKVKEIKVPGPAEDEPPGPGQAGRRGGRGGFGSMASRSERPILAFVPGKSQIVAHNGSGPVVHLLDLENGADVRSFHGDGPFCSPVAVSPDGVALAIGEANGTVRIWEVATGKERLKVKEDLAPSATARRSFAMAGQPLTLNVLAFSPDGKVVATGAEDVHLWDAITGKLLHTLALREGQRDTVGAVSFSPDGKLVATGHNGSSVVLWDLATQRAVRRFDDPDALAVRFLPDGKTLFLVGSSIFHFIDTVTGKPTRRYEGHEHPIAAIAFAPDGKQIATAPGQAMDRDGIRVWDIESKRAVLQGEKSGTRPTRQLVFSPTGNSVAAATSEGIAIWDRQTGALRSLIPASDRGINAYSSSNLVISGDGARLATGFQSGWATTFRMADGKEVQDVQLGEGGALAVTVSPDLRLVAAIPLGGVPLQALRAGDYRVRLWDMETGEEWKAFASGLPAGGQLAFSSDGRSLLVSSLLGQNGLGHVAETATGQSRLAIPKVEGRDAFFTQVEAVAFSPDCRHVALSESLYAQGRNGPKPPEQPYSVRVVDLATGQSSALLRGHKSSVTTLAFSADGRFLASGSGDTTALIWDVAGLLPAVASAPLSAEQLLACWNDLGGDAQQAFRSMCKLADDAGSIEFLRKELRQLTAPVDARQVSKLLADLDSAQFAVRAKAQEQLATLGIASEGELHKALVGKPSAEVRNRIDDLLKAVHGKKLASLRAVEVLEWIKTPAAKELLQVLSKSGPDDALTKEARRSLARLAPLAPVQTQESPPVIASPGKQAKVVASLNVPARPPALQLTPAERKKIAGLLEEATNQLQLGRGTLRNRTMADIAVLQSKIGEREAAQESFAKARELIGNDTQELRMLAGSLARAGDGQAVLALTADIPQKIENWGGPGFRDTVLEESAKALAEGLQINEALQVAEKIEDPERKKTAVDRARLSYVFALGKAGKLSDAEKVMESSIDPLQKVLMVAGETVSPFVSTNYPRTPGIAFLQAQAGARDRAAKSLQQARSLVTSITEAQRDRGRAALACAYAQLGDFKNASQLLNEVKVPASKSRAMGAYVYALAIAGKSKEAEEALAPLGGQQLVEALHHYAAGQFKAGDPERAKRSFAKAHAVLDKLDSSPIGGERHNLLSVQALAGDAAGAVAALPAAPPNGSGGTSVTIHNIVHGMTVNGDYEGALELANRLGTGAWWKGNCLRSIASGQAAKGKGSDALVWINQLSSPSERSNALLGLAEGLAERKQ